MVKAITKSDINKIRRLSVKCCDDVRVQKYVRRMCGNIYHLISEYTKANKLVLDKVLKEFLSGSGPESAGQIAINKKSVAYIVTRANVREGMTFIMNFGMRGCKVILWALSEHPTLINNASAFNERFYVLTGQTDITKIYSVVRNCKEKCALPCSFVSLSSNGPVSASRMTAFPFHEETLRTKREPAFLENNANKIKVTDVYPPLSKHERAYMALPKNAMYLPWVSGYQYWVVNENHYYIKLMKENRQLFISGPSGNTDLQFSVFKIFKDYDFNLSLLSCIAWMCNTPDHSPCEIILAAIPFGLKDWDISMNSFKYINRLLEQSK